MRAAALCYNWKSSEWNHTERNECIINHGRLETLFHVHVLCWISEPVLFYIESVPYFRSTLIQIFYFKFRRFSHVWRASASGTKAVRIGSAIAGHRSWSRASTAPCLAISRSISTKYVSCDDFFVCPWFHLLTGGPGLLLFKNERNICPHYSRALVGSHQTQTD